MKFVVLGGSAQSTPNLVAALMMLPDLPPISLVLVGRSKSRLHAVLRAARLLSQSFPIRLESAGFGSDGLGTALIGADIILIQVRYGGLEGRRFDESFPLAYDVCGDQDLGPGALSAGWRVWPDMKALLRKVHLAAPTALVLMMSSPVSLLVRCGRKMFPNMKLFGVCELPVLTLRTLCGLFDEKPAFGRFGYCGINHLGWFYDLHGRSFDLIKAVARRAPDPDAFPDAATMNAYQGYPTKYVRYHCHHDKVVAEQQRRTSSRAEQLSNLRRHATQIFSTGTASEIEAILLKRPAPWYRHGVVHLVEMMFGRMVDVPIFLSGPNNGYHEFANKEDIMEIPYWVNNTQLQSAPTSGVAPAAIRSSVNSFVNFERRAAEIVASRNAAGMTELLTYHPWVRSERVAAALTAKIIAFCPSR